MDEREYRRNRSGKKKKSEGPISRYKRKMYGSIDDPYCEAGTRVDPKLFARRDKERFNHFGDDAELEAILSAKSSTVSEGENLTPQQEAQINSVFQAGIPVAIVGSYGTALGTKTIWQTFGKVVAGRFGAAAAQALGLSVGDGILPVGDAIALGLLAVTAWQIARNWDDLWQAVDELLSEQVFESYVPHPENLPAFPDAKRAKEKTPRQGGGGKRRRWKDRKKKIYEWDYQHGRVERYNKRGKHEGEFDHETGEQTKSADKNRSVEP